MEKFILIMDNSETKDENKTVLSAVLTLHWLIYVLSEDPSFQEMDSIIDHILSETVDHHVTVVFVSENSTHYYLLRKLGFWEGFKSKENKDVLTILTYEDIALDKNFHKRSIEI